MSRREQPYIALYVQDFAMDEKLMECSANATGVYIRLMCLMHKNEDYGRITLRPKDHLSQDEISDITRQISRKIDAKSKQKLTEIDQKTIEFSLKLQRNMPYFLHEIILGLHELLTENVVQIEGETLVQKRMVKDSEISEKRAISGHRGAQTRYDADSPVTEICYGKTHSKTHSKTEAKPLANSDNIYIYNENENEIEYIDRDRVAGKGKESSRFMPPSVEQVSAYCAERGNGIDPQAFIDHYTSNGWMVGRAKMKDWKAAIRTWERKDKQQTRTHHDNINQSTDNGAAQRVRDIYAPAAARFRQQAADDIKRRQIAAEVQKPD